MQIEQEELSIYEVEELHKNILAQKEKIVIDMSRVKKIDMSIVQLFVSAQKSVSDGSFELQNISDEVKQILSQSACEFLLGEANG
ncbi:MAG: STAS domain-containing protein [Sulfurimonas sp.]|nr:STAS domain-containing protein [Sulfurimonas sp.]